MEHTGVVLVNAGGRFRRYLGTSVRGGASDRKSVV